jgi:hypothetical protein
LDDGDSCEWLDDDEIHMNGWMNIWAFDRRPRASTQMQLPGHGFKYIENII